MGHILLVILKFIGILLASILGIILFLVLLVLVAPFGYGALGEAGEGKVYFQGKISWLFAVILCKVVYSENGLNWYIRIFGITIAGNSEKFQKKKARKLEKKAAKAKKSGKTKKSKAISNTKKVEKKVEETKAIEDKKTEQPKVLEKKQSEKTVEEIIQPEILEETKAVQEDNISLKSRLETLIDQLKNFWQKLIVFFQKLRQNILAIPDKLRSFKENLDEKKAKLDQILAFWSEETTQDAKNRLIREGKKVLLHILPRKFQGEVEFGLEDPYVMGQILAVLGMLMPLYQNKLKVQPDFEEEKLLGKFSLKGRIIPGYLIYKALILLLNKNIRKTIKEGKQLIGGN